MAPKLKDPLAHHINMTKGIQLQDNWCVSNFEHLD